MAIPGRSIIQCFVANGTLFSFFRVTHTRRRHLLHVVIQLQLLQCKNVFLKNIQKIFFFRKLTLTLAIAVAWLRSTPCPLLPEVVVGGGPPVRGTPLLEAAEGEDVEVAEADIDEGGSNEDNVVGNDADVEDEEPPPDPLWACNAKRGQKIH